MRECKKCEIEADSMFCPSCKALMSPVQNRNDDSGSSSRSYSFKMSPAKKYENALGDKRFRDLIQFVKSFPEISERPPQKTMVAFYKGRRGFVWIRYPTERKGSIGVHFQKGNYPDEFVSHPRFIEKEWGDYPRLNVESNSDVELCKEIIEYAYLMKSK